MQTEQLAKVLLAVFLSSGPDLRERISSLLKPLSDQQRTQFMKDLLAIDINQPLQDLINQTQEIAKDISSLLHTATEAFEPREKMDWLIEGTMLTSSIAVMVGEPGSGKTWSVMHLALSITGEQPWLGKQVKQGTVLWVDAESGKYRMLERLKRVMTGLKMKDQETPFYFITAGDCLLDLRKVDDINRLQAMIVQTGAALCVIDALADIMPGADENLVKDVQPVFANLRQLVDTTGCAFLLIHHTNKMGGYRGSTAIAGAIDLMIQVTRDEKDLLRFDSKKARDTELFSFAGKMDWTEDEFKMTLGEVPSKTRALSEAERYVVDYLMEHDGTATIPVVMKDAEVNGANANSVRKAFKSLKDKGKIERTNPNASKGTSAAYRLVDPALGG